MSKLKGKERKTSSKSKPDQAEKLLEEWNDVFADIINVLVFHGKRYVKEENLMDGPTASQYKTAEGPYNEKNRDICKEDVRNGVCYAIWGLENQTEINEVMPVRCMGYDYATYDRIVKKKKEKNKQKKIKVEYTRELLAGQTLCPVVTLVLYFGTEKWDAPKTLWDLVKVPEELKEYIPNYRINLVEVAFLDDETIQKFSSDFRVIAEYFKEKRLGKEAEIMYNEKKKWDHVAEMMEFLHTFTNDTRYRDFKSVMVEESQKGEVSMCTLLDAFEKKGIEKGIEQGIEKGIEQGIKKGIEQGIEKGIEQGIEQGRYLSVESLARKCKMPIETAMEQLDFSEKEKSGYAEWKAVGGIPRK